MTDDPDVHIDWARTEGRDAYQAGRPCEPPDHLGLVATLSWVREWLAAAEANEDTTRDHTDPDHSPPLDR